mmetsp:Transcript_13596/g.33432  ORF Transcript_13596/g.33432 Transcript_13596/m.33432 type:complete len:363 (-) Transcript_13596:450-1538(-)
MAARGMVLAFNEAAAGHEVHVTLCQRLQVQAYVLRLAQNIFLQAPRYLRQLLRRRQRPAEHVARRRGQHRGRAVRRRGQRGGSGVRLAARGVARAQVAHAVHAEEVGEALGVVLLVLVVQPVHDVLPGHRGRRARVPSSAHGLLHLVGGDQEGGRKHHVRDVAIHETLVLHRRERPPRVQNRARVLAQQKHRRLRGNKETTLGGPRVPFERREHFSVTQFRDGVVVDGDQVPFESSRDAHQLRHPPRAVADVNPVLIDRGHEQAVQLVPGERSHVLAAGQKTPVHRVVHKEPRGRAGLPQREEAASARGELEVGDVQLGHFRDHEFEFSVLEHVDAGEDPGSGKRHELAGGGEAFCRVHSFR